MQLCSKNYIKKSNDHKFLRKNKEILIKEKVQEMTGIQLKRTHMNTINLLWSKQKAKINLFHR